MRESFLQNTRIFALKGWESVPLLRLMGVSEPTNKGVQMNALLAEAYAIGRKETQTAGRYLPAAVSVEMEDLMRESAGNATMLELLGAYNEGAVDQNNILADEALLKDGTFTAQELADFPSVGMRKQNEAKYGFTG